MVRWQRDRRSHAPQFSRACFVLTTIYLAIACYPAAMEDTEMKVKDDTEDKIRDRRDRDDKDGKRDKDRRDKSRSRERRDSGWYLSFIEFRPPD
jgi:hypothetical protein